jgi:hypothetical protein
VAVLVRTTQEQQFAHHATPAIVGEKPSSPSAHERRMKAELNLNSTWADLPGQAKAIVRTKHAPLALFQHRNPQKPSQKIKLSSNRNA